MRNKKLLIALLVVLVSLPIFFYSRGVSAQAEYTMDDVSLHNTSEDCWMVYGDYVYDFTSVLDWHKKFIDVTPWCGLDMTEDFETKGDIGRDHVPSTYSSLTDYLLGDLFGQGVVVEEEVVVDPVEVEIKEEVEYEIEDDDDNESPKIIYSTEEEDGPKGPYNLAVPLFSSIILYVGLYIISGSKFGKSNKYFSRPSFNLFWNTILFLSLIPAFGFGIFMMIRYQKPQWDDIDFNFMYWHVELSVVMGTVAIMHFIQRFKQYTAPLKILKMKK